MRKYISICVFLFVILFLNNKQILFLLTSGTMVYDDNYSYILFEWNSRQVSSKSAHYVKKSSTQNILITIGNRFCRNVNDLQVSALESVFS